jgi:2-hydroxychromene-2-carboxylate isomerase
MREQPRFYLDLTHPDCYLAGERVLRALPELAEWVPVIGRELGAAAFDLAERPRIAQRATELGLLELRWPSVWPPDPEPAALSATFAKSGGRTVSFAQALMRQGFAGGRDLGELDTVLIAGAAAEMHPAAVIKATGLRGTKARLAAACAEARADGVTALPAISWQGEVFAGPDALERAAAAITGART